MSEISARPWKVVDLPTWGCGIQREDEHESFIVHGIYRINAEHIVKCVNEHDSLVARAEKAEAEVERLKIITDATLKHFTELKQRILKEIDKDGFARLIVHESMMKDIDFVIDTINEKDGEG